MDYRVAIIDDEIANLESMERILKSDRAEVFCFRDPREAIAFLQKNSVDVVLTDLRMDLMNGLELLETIKHLEVSAEVVLMTAYGTVEIAVEAMKKGAYDFITKPLQRVHVLKSVHRALDHRRLITENQALRDELNSQSHDQTQLILGKSEAIRNVLEVATQSAGSQASVLIDGESGTGKGILAEFIHRNSSHAKGLLVKINCTAIPDNLLEGELFGYEPGAFTGASKRKKGRVEVADKGTLFLDEIGIAPHAFQAKLLRFLQEGDFERLGSNETLHVDTRVISATNTDLKKAIISGQMREDLYYRLNVIHIRVPPLRDRTDDIPLLVQKFLTDSAKKNGRLLPLITEDAMEYLVSYPWPGNIRELQNLMERLVVLNRTGKIGVEDLPPEVGGVERQKSFVVPLGTPLRQIERMMMDETLKSTKGDKKLAAKLLGIHPRTIYRYLETDEEEVGTKVDFA